MDQQIIQQKNSFHIKNLYESYTNLDENILQKLFNIDSKEWLKDLNMYSEFYKSFDKKIPKQLQEQLNNLSLRLNENAQTKTI